MTVSRVSPADDCAASVITGPFPVPVSEFRDTDCTSSRQRADTHRIKRFFPGIALTVYIFAYTNDGDIYWTFDDGQSNWTQILTAADIGADYGADYFFSASFPRRKLSQKPKT